MKKRILILLGILIIGGGTAGICWKTGVFGQQEVSGDAVYVTQISEINGEASGVSNRYAGVVEPQETVSVELENGRSVKEVKVKTGDQIKKGQLLFEYDLSSIQDSLEEAQLELDRLKNEASSLNEQIATLEKEKKKASQDNQLSYTIEIETNKIIGTSDMKRICDLKGNPLLLFINSWSVGMVEERNPNLKLSEFGKN